MTFRDDLFSVLHLGWKTSRQAWGLLSPEQETTFTSEAAAVTGRDMDQLAYDLRRLGHGKPARLAFSAAFILNGLASQTLQFDRELADKTSQIVAILAEMLLELEATSEVTTAEPVEIVEVIQHRWGLVLYEDQSSSSVPQPHFQKPEGTRPPVEGIHTVLIQASEALVWASETLLNRVIHEGEFPYTASLSRIHHLGMTIRDRVISLPMLQRTTLDILEPITDIAQLPPALPIAIDNPSAVEAELVLEEPLVLHSESDAIAMTGESFANRLPHVLIIDESPFFRMLLTTAIEAAGYATQTVANLAEAQAISQEKWDLMVCDEKSSPHRSKTLRQATTITLITRQNVDSAMPIDGHHQILRTDLNGLLTMVKSILGPVASNLRLSA